MKKILILPLLAILGYILIFFSPLIKGYLPIPADPIVGLYHPWRDYFSQQYSSGIPYKNFLVTDPVRQQLVWRKLSIESIKSGNFPGWNPYSLAGTPLAGNVQSAAFYPLNIFYAVFPFSTAWTWQILLQTILGAIFMFLFLKSKKLALPAVAMGTMAWVGSGFFIAWWSLNTLVSCAIYLPLMLLSIDNILTSRRSFSWMLVFAFATASSFLAGASQIFLYILIFSGFYFLISCKFKFKKSSLWLVVGLFLVLLITLPQWFSVWNFSLNSVRSINLNSWQQDGWFLPWQNLIQFVAPDFFGNPATLNYFGIWNYMEFVGYIGLIPLIFALAAAIKFQKEYRFFVISVLLSLVLMLPTIFAKIPYVFQIPILSLAQPTRLMFLVDFSLAVLCAYGFNWWLGSSSKLKISTLVSVLVGLILLGSFLIAKQNHWDISIRNLYLPLAFFATFVLIVVINKRYVTAITILILALTAGDLARFGLKFEPYSSGQWLFPDTKTINFLRDNVGQLNRVATTDDQVFPANFSNYYRLQFVGGYDSVILSRYAEFISALQRGSADIGVGLGFNRIIIPNNLNNRLFNLLNAKYVLSLRSINTPGYKLVYQEGETKVFENANALPRFFYVKKVTYVNKERALETLFSNSFNPVKEAVVEMKGQTLGFKDYVGVGNIDVIEYGASRVVIQTDNQKINYLVFLDAYYPNWRVFVDNVEKVIYPTNYAFRGLEVPAGKHRVVFSFSVL